MNIYIGADHNGFDFKRDLARRLTEAGHIVVDEGDEQRHPDVIIPQVAPQQDGDAD